MREASNAFVTRILFRAEFVVERMLKQESTR